MTSPIRRLISADTSLHVGPTTHRAAHPTALPCARIVELARLIRGINADAIIRDFVAEPVAVRERSMAGWFRRRETR